MSFSTPKLTLMIGRMVAVPAPASLMSALRRAQVTNTDSGPSGFQLEFQVKRGSSPLDYDVVTQGLLAPFNRVVLMVTLSTIPTVIMDGLITRIELHPRQGNQPDTMVVTGEDISVAMDLEEKTMPFPAMSDFMIADLIMAEYAMYGIIPMALPTTINLSSDPLDYTIQQPGITDRAFLNKLAARNGYVFQIIPGPAPMVNTGYFGPPRRIGVPQAALTVNELPVSNVNSLSFSYDALAPTTVVGLVQDSLETDMDIPIAALLPLRVPPMAAMPAILANVPNIRISLLDPEGMDPIQAETVAQSMVDRSTDNVLTATGELDVLRYGSVLSAPGLVGVRGAGYGHDGLYYVQQVTHEIKPESYTQQFTLTREGWGSTIPMVRP
ncbi:hypothetical protein [Archangium lansingense]|uniref:Phage protein D n=1 Tax=Archangium lansingense TaxID=2995310 RepID=A0ABT4AN32_9BACT|nr:hypothetical protein [Archangium lansinium]MCY1083065.1 hypothetical protein [Archangium lansinium]